MRKTDIREQPAYTVAEAARYLKLAPATLRSWVAGRPYRRATGIAHSSPLIRPAANPPPMLSFWNLIEAHVLRSLRTEHGVSMDALRKAVSYAQKTLQIERLLLSHELRTDAGKLLLERYGELIDLSASGQMAMRHMFNEHLARVEWDEWKFPVRLYPFASSDVRTARRPIAIDAHVAFGRPVLMHRGITTGAIAERIDTGESLADLAIDYDLTEREIEEAVLYERAA
ncbi:MAG: DUF433 domain-containing protein [Rhodanobacteraceae bacterium]